MCTSKEQQRFYYYFYYYYYCMYAHALGMPARHSGTIPNDTCCPARGASPPAKALPPRCLNEHPKRLCAHTWYIPTVH